MSDLVTIPDNVLTDDLRSTYIGGGYFVLDGVTLRLVGLDPMTEMWTARRVRQVYP